MPEGTIAWLPIKDAPRDGETLFLTSKVNEVHWAEWVGYWNCALEIFTNEYCKDLKPTHFAYINSPEVES